MSQVRLVEMQYNKGFVEKRGSFKQTFLRCSFHTLPAATVCYNNIKLLSLIVWTYFACRIRLSRMDPY